MKYLRPFFSFYGSKWNSIPYYPEPSFDSIVEPFAGSASYSLRFYNRKVFLYDIDPVICGIWNYLISVSPEEIMRLPIEFDNVDNLNIPQEAKWLIGFWISQASSHIRKTPSPWGNREIKMNKWGVESKERISSQVKYIKHWEIKQSSYDAVPNFLSTWFIDPPYTVKGKFYLFHKIDYAHLSNWCKDRKGQVIVCEQDGANWLPFRKFKKTKSLKTKISNEVIWAIDSSWMDL